MVVTVHLHTILQRQTEQGLQRQLEVRLPAESTLGDLLEQLVVELPPDALLMAVNSRTVALDQHLVEGDEVHLMPAISGGRY